MATTTHPPGLVIGEPTSTNTIHLYKPSPHPVAKARGHTHKALCGTFGEVDYPQPFVVDPDTVCTQCIKLLGGSHQ